MIKAVIFDLDDTLYDESQFVRGGFKRVASYISQNFDRDEEKVYFLLRRLLKKYGRGKVFDMALEQLGVPCIRKTICRMVSVYRYHRSKFFLYPEARALLFNLKKRGYRLGLVTDGNARVQRGKVKLLGIQSCFDAMIFSREYGNENEKPNVTIYKKCLSKLNVRPQESVYIGDNPYKDFVNAKTLGMYTVRVMKGQYKTVAVNSKFDAHYRIGSLRRALSIIRILDNK